MVLGAEGAAGARGARVVPGVGEESREEAARGSWGRRVAPRRPPVTGPCSLQEEAKAKEEEGVPDDEGWVKVTRRGRRPVLPRTEAASLRVLERERRKRARKELLNFYAWQHRETKMERKGAPWPCPSHPCLGARLWSCGHSASPSHTELPSLLGWERGPGGLPAPPKPCFTFGCVLVVGRITEVFFFLLIIWVCWVLIAVSRLLIVMRGSLVEVPGLG